MRRRISVFDIINTIILSLIAIICMIPFLYTLFIAISDGKYLISGAVTFFPKGINFESFKFVFTNTRFDVLTAVISSCRSS